MNRYSIILGIESSCDDTSASIWKEGKILANETAGQPVHEAWGGVVPELASRAHQSHIIPVIQSALDKAQIRLEDLDAIACTQGPGLMGSLMVGWNTAKGLSLALNKPLIGVHHLQAHVAALYLEHDVKFPLLTLLVSGGHTQLLLISEGLNMEIIGQSQDDAAGEAFDKAAKLLGLGYPGGPHVDRLAQSGDPAAFEFPDSQTPELDFSFSGIKTSLLYFLRKQQELDPDFMEVRMHDICASYQFQVVSSLLKRVNKAIRLHKPASLGLVGGVSANSELRHRFSELAMSKGLEVYIPSFGYCTDNAAMIAQAGAMLLEKGEQTPLSALPFAR
jgi:N6-L-threonylcarbamoyladenine synthase